MAINYKEKRYNNPKLNGRAPWKVAALLLFALLTGGELAAMQNELVNPGFETWENGLPTGWECTTPDAIFRRDTECTHGGKSAIHPERDPANPESDSWLVLRQEVVYDTPTTLPVIFGGWSRAENVVDGREYCLWIDLYHPDGSLTYAVKSWWGTDTFNWRHTLFCHRPSLPVTRIVYHVVVGGSEAGKVWLDDLELYRGEPDTQISAVRVDSAFPASPHGVFVEGYFFNDVNWQAVLTAASGEELASARGEGREVRWLAPLATPAAELEITAERDGKTARYRYPVELPPAPVNPVTDGFQVWTADSMTNVSPLTYPAADAPRAVELELAKAEAESAQILLTAGAKPLDKVNVEVSELVNDAGEPLAGSAKWELVGYLPRRRPHAQHPNGYGEADFWLPDPLLPAREFKVEANATQGVWLTVRADRHAKAGVYRGSATVSAGGDKVEVPIAVRVFNFALPEKFSMPTAFSLMDSWLFRSYPDRYPNELRREAWDVMLDHRLNPDDISRTTEPRVEDLVYAAGRGMNRFCVFNLVPRPTDNRLWVCYAPVASYTDALIDDFQARLAPYVEELRRHNLLQYAYVYGFDERGEEYYPAMMKIHNMLKTNYPGLAFMTTSRNYRLLRENPGQAGHLVADWFCPLTDNYSDALSAELRALGHQVWWYVCCGPRYPYANFASLEYPFIEGRMLAWQTFQHRVDGLLYWHVNYWEKVCYLDGESCFQIAFFPSFVEGVSGDGQLLYPGEAGVLPSIRLANVRDGSEDYDYLAMRGEEALELCNELSPGMTDFTRSPAKLREARRHLAEALEK